jgi:uncharacterized protein
MITGADRHGPLKQHEGQGRGNLSERRSCPKLNTRFRRADTFRNVLQNPKVGLIFIVPGKGETLRVSGTAQIVRDGWLLESMIEAGRTPELALVVGVEEAFAHCTKCMVRSKIWQPETWNPEGLASIGEAMVAHGQLDMSVAEMVAIAENDGRTCLY